MRRVDQLLSSLGYASRSEARSWVAAGRVGVGSRIVIDPGERVDAGLVRVDGAPLDHPDGVLLMMHKPAGRVCSHDAAEGPRVHDLLPERWQRRNPLITSIGRLDKETTGLLLLTDLSALVHRLTSPRHKVPKTYRATVDREVPAGAEEAFLSGTLRMAGDAEPCAPAQLKRLGSHEVEVILTEGRYHQVRRMLATLGCSVVALHRSRFGDLELGDLPENSWKELPLNSFDSP